MLRRFFARVKQVLSSRQLWNEFLKCLELYTQEVLTRVELMPLVADIFAQGNHSHLLDDFNRLLNTRGAVEHADEDVWFSMPLSEIDFSQCRRCTPSYRALPKSYPVPPCSERTSLCKSVLNDTWVSVPTGSEASKVNSLWCTSGSSSVSSCLPTHHVSPKQPMISESIAVGLAKAQRMSLG